MLQFLDHPEGPGWPPWNTGCETGEALGQVVLVPVDAGTGTGSIWVSYAFMLTHPFPMCLARHAFCAYLQRILEHSSALEPWLPGVPEYRKKLFLHLAPATADKFWMCGGLGPVARNTLM